MAKTGNARPRASAARPTLPPRRLEMRQVQRHRRRRLVVALLVVLAVAGAGLVAIAVLRDDASPAEADARRRVQRYLSAWEQTDLARMQRYVTTPPDELSSTYVEAFGGLSVTRARFERRGVSVDGDRGEAFFTARLQLAGLGRWEYRGRVPLEHDGSRWLVAWSAAALHPELAPGRRLVATRQVPPRAPILGVDGSPLDAPGLDATDVTGGLGVATAAEAAELGPTYKAGDTIGSSGLQATLERQLAGRPSGAVELQDESGRVEQTLFRFPGRAPEPVQTTLDPAMQRAAQQAVAGTLQPAAVVAIDAASGDVRAVVSRPAGGFARAVEGRYPPGSTFKIVTTTAALTAGITPQEVIDCPPSVTTDGKVFVNAEGGALGPIPLTTAFARSCNTAFVNIANRLTDDQLAAAATTFGFDGQPQLGVPSFGGTFPPPAGPVDHAAAALGQAQVEASPLHMASVAAAVAAGEWRPPRVLADASPGEPRPLDPAVAVSLREMMALVVAEGTGTAAQLPGSPVHGKTGTAEFGTATPPQTHAWFIGFRDDLAFAVLVEDGGFGGEVAAPIAARFLASLSGT